MPWLMGPTAHILRVELEDVAPRVWRTLAVRSDATLPEFNRMLVTVMGWTGYHLHCFNVGKLRFGPPDLDDPMLIDEAAATVIAVLPEVGASLQWSYDFGDGWEHQVVVESIESIEPDDPTTRCVAGANACPPEDCGGVPGYEHLREVIADPNHDEHAELTEWLGPEFDAEHFDVDAATEALRAID